MKCFKAIALCSVSVTAFAGDTAAIPLSDTNGQDLLCGPRCVDYVLRYYGNATGDFAEFVREFPSNSAGTSMQDLSDALRKYDVRTKAVSTSWKEALNWPHPVIAHTREQASGSGHFLVWHPASDRSRSIVWDGLNAFRCESTWQLHDRIDGGVLLTVPPGEAASQQNPFTLSLSNRVAGMGLGLLFTQSLVCALLFRSMTRS